jgi:hypothetical protein
MNRQLERIEEEFESARARLRALAQVAPFSVWPVRPDPNRWSIADCVEHLNRTASAFLPLLRAGLEQAEADRRPDRSYRRDPMGWLLSVIMPPPVRFARVKTTSDFEPSGNVEPAELVRTFERLQDEQIAYLRAADGLPLNRIRIRSPFDARTQYNAYSCLVILPRHQHRHLWQAERVAEELAKGGKSVTAEGRAG